MEPEAASTEEGKDRFGASRRALLQRRLLGFACVGLGAALALAGAALVPDLAGKILAVAVGAGALAVSLGPALRPPLEGREVLLTPQALELRRGDFRRLIVFDSLIHLHVVQTPSGRLVSLRLDLEDGSVLLRDLEGLPKLFAAAAQRRPPKALIEVEERRVDWGEPLPWVAAALAASAAVALVLAR